VQGTGDNIPYLTIDVAFETDRITGKNNLPAFSIFDDSSNSKDEGNYVLLDFQKKLLWLLVCCCGFCCCCLLRAAADLRFFKKKKKKKFFFFVLLLLGHQFRKRLNGQL